jgi:NTP pyrophosphatase (non-canonical NTP hydrolase)
MILPAMPATQKLECTLAHINHSKGIKGYKVQIIFILTDTGEDSMTKLQRLIKKCMEQNNLNSGTAESFNSALKDLGRWVLTLHNNGKLIFDNTAKDNMKLHDNLNVKDFIKEVGENALKCGYFKRGDKTFFELIALCHKELSEALNEFNKGYHPCYTYYRDDSEPKGIPSELADVILRIFIMCYQYDIDIETVLIEKSEYMNTKFHRDKEQ